MCQAALPAQTQPGATAFQQADSLAAGRGGRGGRGITVPIPRAETGKPFSAMATTQTMQTYLDGTHVSQTATMLQYRDAEGRVRTETSEPGNSSSEPAKSIMIRDPVAGVAYRLDPARKTAVKLTMVVVPPGPAAGGGGGRRGGRGDSAPGSNSDATAQALQRLQQLAEAQQQLAEAARNNPNNIVEDLGMTSVNGVPARGTRNTTVVPPGAIGNDREFRSVTESWFSPDLNLLIKSVSTDPRFGTTTYELTNISRQPPDPSLFHVPADYNVVSNPPPPLASNVIEGIEFRGMSRVPQDTLRAAILTKVGDVYDEEALRGDFTALWKTNHFTDVQMKSEPGARGGVILRFVVTERP
jgi:hypothetical protein